MRHQFKKGNHPKSEWKEGHEPWNKGLHGVQKNGHNIPHTEETKKKMRDNHVGMKGRHHTQKTKDKIGTANWKGGRKAYIKRYRDSEKGIKASRKHSEAHFDYIYNSYFEGSHLHHMSYTFPVIGMYVPAKLHRCESHDLIKTNMRAFEWYLGGRSW